MILRIKTLVKHSVANMLALVLLAGIQAASQEFPTVITTVAGGIPRSGPALQLPLSPNGITLDAVGNLFIADATNGVIRKIDSSGIMSIVAGNRVAAFGGDGGPAINASFFAPSAVAVDSAGNIFVADRGNNQIRRIDHATQQVTTVAGTSLCAFDGDGLPATIAHLCDPTGIALDAQENLIIADRANNRIRKVDHTTQIISTIAGTGGFGFTGDGVPATSASLAGPADIAIDSTGNLFIADIINNRVRRVDHATQIITTVAGNGTSVFSGDGGPAISAGLPFPQRVVVSTSGALFIADGLDSRVRRVDAKGLITTVAGNGIRSFAGDGGPAVTASLDSPSGMALDSTGNLLIADNGTNRIRIVDPVGTIHTIAGNGEAGFAGDHGLATDALLLQPTDAVVDDAGNMFIADRSNHRIRKVDTTGVITTFAGNGQAGFSGDGGPASSARLNLPFGLAVDHSGNLFVGDEGNNRVRKIDAQGIITTIAGNGVAFLFSGDGGPAVNASLTPLGLELDSAGNLFIADSFNNRVRMVNPMGIITTVAGTGSSIFAGDGGPASNANLNGPVGLALDKVGNLFVADSGNNRIRKIDRAGIITTVAGNGTAGGTSAGNPAIETPLNLPTGVGIDRSGNLLIADFTDRIQKVDSAGIIHTIVGTGAPGFSGDGGLGLDATFNFPSAVRVDASGNLLIADQNNNRIRKAVFLPLAQGQSIVTLQDQSVPVTLIGASPRGSVPLTFSIFRAPGHGVLSGFVPATGAVVYTPAPGYFGDDQFSFKVNDGNADSPEGVVRAVVQGLPDFSLIEPSPTVRAGKSITFNFTVLALNGFNSPVSFACSDLPPFSTCSFSPATATPDPIGVPVMVRIQTKGDQNGGTGTLAGSEGASAISATQVSATQDSGKTPPGTYVVTVTALTADGTKTHVMPLIFTVVDAEKH
jgi:sugar lactone lactonase YvrE